MPIPHQAAMKMTLWIMNEVRKLQQNPELGLPDPCPHGSGVLP